MAKNTPSISKEDQIKDLHSRLILSEGENQTIYKIKMNKLHKLFVSYCKDKNYEMIIYLMTSPDLELNYDLNFSNEGFKILCQNNNLNMIKYLVTEPTLKSHIDITTGSNVGILIACERGYLELVKYLLTSPDLTKHANIYDYKDRALISAYNRKDIFSYLLDEYGLTIANLSEETYKKYPEMVQLINMKNLNEHLQQELPSLNENKVKSKI